MMTRDQWLLCKLAEEAAEVAQQAMKTQQFGFYEKMPGQAKDNLERLVDEVQDLLITMECLMGDKDGNFYGVDSDKLSHRLHKMEKYLKLSIQENQVEETTL